MYVSSVNILLCETENKTSESYKECYKICLRETDRRMIKLKRYFLLHEIYILFALEHKHICNGNGERND
jgi:hypothetical protein